MLDPRIYRAALIPAFLALIVAAFSLREQPHTLTATLAPDAFDGQRAFTELERLAAAEPRRPPGGPGDRALARRVTTTLRGAGFHVRTRTFSAATAVGRRDLEDVVGVRTGFSSRRIVVVAHRDSLHVPGRAELSGTAALLELARVFDGQTPSRTIVLVSTSGGSAGSAGAAEFARHSATTVGANGPIDAVLALGDLAGTTVRRPIVVPWSNGLGLAPLDLRRTVEAAVRLEAGRRAGDVRTSAQFAHLAFPLTVGEQGELAAEGLPAVLLSISGERGPGAHTPISELVLQQLGRAVLRSINALSTRTGPAAAPSADLALRRKLVPGWAIRLLVGTLILPALVAAIDGFARVRRRRHPVGRWLIWVGLGVMPFALAVAFAYVLELVGLLPVAPPAPAPRGAVPLDGAAIAALGAIALVLLVGWLGLRALGLRALLVGESPGSPGAAAALALVMAALATAVWIRNPYAAAFLLLPLHGWLLVTIPEVRLRRSIAVAVVVLCVVPIVLVAVYFTVLLGLDPGAAAWNALLLLVGGHVGLLAALAWCVLLGSLGSVLAMIRHQGIDAPDEPAPRIRGPISYAGPGSLGGTESALRR